MIVLGDARARGPGSRIASALIAALKHKEELKRYERAVGSIAHGTDLCCKRVGSAHRDFTVGTRWFDTFKPGETLVCFSDAHPRGGYHVSNVWTYRIEDEFRTCRDLGRSQREARLIEIARRDMARKRAPKALDPAERQVELEIAQSELIKLAALAISKDDLEQIRSVDNGVPVLAIIARSSSRGRAAIDYRAIVTTFPLQGLGTRAPAGRA